MLNGREITVELRGVNARFLEYSSRLPRAFAFLEDPLKKLVAARVSRGKVELSLTVQNTTAADTVVTVNWPLAKGYRDAMTALSEQLELKNDMSVSLIARMPDVLAQTAAPLDEEALWADVQAVAGQAVERFPDHALPPRAKSSRPTCSPIWTWWSSWWAGSRQTPPAGSRRTRTSSTTRLQELLADRSIDESRLVTEAAIFADKTAIDEETVRLHSHIAQYRDILSGDGPVGRKLDFLTQELNREANTIGSKCQDVDITRLVVELKSEIEKLREQLQNLE